MHSERNYGDSVSSEPLSPGDSTTRLSFVSRPRADTKQVAVLQLLPFLPIAITIFGSLPGGWNATTLACAVAFTSIVQVVVARVDVRNLGNRGFVEQAPAMLALVSPILYLYVRGRRCEGHDPSAPGAVTWAAITTVAAAIIATAVTIFVWGAQGLIAGVGTVN